jgi:hypothetical protein
MNSKESADHLFHFTERYDSIVSIMNDKFKPFFCIEDLSFMYEERRNTTFAFPIVCFCDIPLKRNSVHRTNYGEYGIGLTKEWGIRKNLNIVNYSFKESLKSASFRILVDYYVEKCTDLNEKSNHNFSNAFSILLMTSKPYEGRQYDKTERKWTNKNVRFYNEREWRFLPLVDQLNWSISLDDYAGDYEAFFNAIKKEQPKIQENYTLDFTVDDIDYIFLRDKTETEQFLKDISTKYDDNELKKIRSLIYFNENTKSL